MQKLSTILFSFYGYLVLKKAKDYYHSLLLRANLCKSYFTTMSCLFLSVCTLYTTCLKAQNSELLLHHADSTFQQGNYTEAFKYYDKLLTSRQYYTPKMLLRMSYVKEALGDYTGALYYLNQYYHFESDRKVLKKMDELSKLHELSGYIYSDKEYFISFFKSYKNYILVFLLLVLSAFWVFILYKKRKSSNINFELGLFASSLICFLWLTNYRINTQKAIIKSDQVHLMEAPSAGAKLIDTLNKGHRVEVIDKKDIWCGIKWKDKKVYIRQNNLLPIN